MIKQESGEITQRVFCVGMNKTGTSTMRHCFEILDLVPIASPSTRSVHDRAAIKKFHSDHDYQELIEVARNYKAFEDRPWNMWEAYRHLDQHFPDSLFILTVRNTETWWTSIENWVASIKPHMLDRYKTHLRCNDFDKDAMIESYQRHNTEVIDYFHGTEKLLVMNFEKGDGWEKLCKFLDKPIPKYPFPHANQQNYNANSRKDTQQARISLNKAIRCQACNHVTQMAKVSKNNQRSVKSLRHTLRKIKSKALSQLRSLQLFTKTSNPPDYNKQLRILQQQYPTLSINKLAVVACFFNPSNSYRRTHNFHQFLKGIESSGVHILVVELAFGSRDFEIEHKHVIRLRSDSIMWHKERLLNLGIKQLLSEGYEKITWLDGDIYFHNPNWPWLISAQLEKNRLCQVFSQAHIRAADGSTILKNSAAQRFCETNTQLSNDQVTGQTGFGWAARAEVFNRTLLYDRAIVGGGDKMIFMASIIKEPQHPVLIALTQSHLACEKCGHRNSSPAYTSDFLSWAEHWTQAIGQQIGYVDMVVEDMFHGKRSDRKYMSRRNILFRHYYDPAEDLTMDTNGCYKWSDRKPEFKKDIRSYFLSRRENV